MYLIAEIIDHIKLQEGLYSGSRTKSVPVKKNGLVYPYKDATGTPTIGYGNTFYEDGKAVSLHDSPITIERANLLFNKISGAFSVKVKQFLTSDLNPFQFGALVSLAYNIGIKNFTSSTLLKKVNANPDDETIHNEFMKWNKSKGKILNGLTKRRTLESEFYKKKNNIINLNFMEKIKTFFQNYKIVSIVVGVVLLGLLVWKLKKR